MSGKETSGIAASEDKAEGFPEVFKEELRVIAARRSWQATTTVDRKLLADCDPENLAGLALSGGGIRSATYCLGLLQGLAELKMLRAFDYVSTVSGGGYIGGWWSAWLSRKTVRAGRDIFPDREGNDLIRSSDAYICPGSAQEGSNPNSSAKLIEGSASADRDPIHHLRLFANYLTPRRGFLSLDTWRAATFICRNLILTWIILIPVLVAVVLCGQLYYTAISAATDFPAGASRVSRSDMPSRPDGANPSVADWLRKKPSEGRFLARRAIALLAIPLLLLAFTAVLAGLWVIRNQGGPLPLALLGAEVGVVVLFFSFSVFFRIPDNYAVYYFLAFLICLIIFPTGIIVQSLWARLMAAGRTPDDSPVSEETTAAAVSQWRKEVYRNQLARAQTRLLLLVVMILVVLGFSGFGHELVAYVCCYSVTDGKTWVQIATSYAAKSLSLSVLVGTFASLVYTWQRSAPVGGGDQKGSDSDGAIGRLVLAITPPLTLIVLCLLIAWVCHALLSYLLYMPPNPEKPEDIGVLNTITWLSVGLCILYAAFELEWPGRRPVAFKFILLPTIIIICYVVSILTASSLSWNRSGSLYWLAAVTAAGLSLILVPPLRSGRAPGGPGVKLALILLLPLLLASIIWIAERAILSAPLPPNADIFERLAAEIPIWRNRNPGVIAGALSGLTCCGAFFIIILLGRLKGTVENGLVLAICTAVYVVMGILLVASFSRFDMTPVRAAVALAATSLGWVVSHGWLVDPNALSMHSFYKSRLVRAYLGASNPKRRQEEITETAERDDILLSELTNDRQGAPYHLINTTLNLVGSRDLATAQRSSAIFTLSKLFCGSPRTGYRPTAKYMGGGLSLGTAVAISGAAVSPNMGALKTSASVAMILTLLNVRLGFWAPTPNRRRWQSPQARLWPYYTLREFLSETNDLSTYCYLTDGGHFDNTGLYSLVQRGCRFIVVADCGADPKPCFQDLGDAIRRCRIDFGAEIEIDVSPLVPSGTGMVSAHCVVGTVNYSEEHVKKVLGWKSVSEEDRRGYIILFKPSLPLDVTTDVWQYKQENAAFPHQTTADQWYDEAQFESYRRLGLHCARQAFGGLPRAWGESNSVPTEAAIRDLFEQAYVSFAKAARGTAQRSSHGVNDASAEKPANENES